MASSAIDSAQNMMDKNTWADQARSLGEIRVRERGFARLRG